MRAALAKAWVALSTDPNSGMPLPWCAIFDLIETILCFGLVLCGGIWCIFAMGPGQ